MNELALRPQEFFTACGRHFTYGVFHLGEMNGNCFAHKAFLPFIHLLDTKVQKIDLDQ